MTYAKTTSPPETVYISTDTIYCEGGNGPLGHPRVYLTIDKNTGAVECPYCGKHFIKKEHNKRN